MKSQVLRSRLCSKGEIFVSRRFSVVALAKFGFLSRNVYAEILEAAI
jgi:hypothetical protein